MVPGGFSFYFFFLFLFLICVLITIYIAVSEKKKKRKKKGRILKLRRQKRLYNNLDGKYLKSKVNLLQGTT